MLALALALAPTANAGFKRGKYVGMTAQGERIAFKAKKRGVRKLTFRVFVKCEDGASQTINGSQGRAPYGDKHRFVVDIAGDGFTVQVSGKLKRRRAKGKIETVGTRPNGAGCAGSVQWMAKRRPPPSRR